MLDKPKADDGFPWVAQYPARRSGQPRIRPTDLHA